MFSMGGGTMDVGGAEGERGGGGEDEETGGGSSLKFIITQEMRGGGRDLDEHEEERKFTLHCECPNIKYLVTQQLL